MGKQLFKFHSFIELYGSFMGVLWQFYGWPNAKTS
jgi:hypothetical protein